MLIGIGVRFIVLALIFKHLWEFSMFVKQNGNQWDKSFSVPEEIQSTILCSSLIAVEICSSASCTIAIALFSSMMFTAFMNSSFSESMLNSILWIETWCSCRISVMCWCLITTLLIDDCKCIISAVLNKLIVKLVIAKSIPKKRLTHFVSFVVEWTIKFHKLSRGLHPHSLWEREGLDSQWL